MRLRTFSLLPAALAVLSAIVASFSGGMALGQNEPEASERNADSPDRQPDDEVVVTGRRVGQLRAEVEKARERAYGIFNEINSSNDFDFQCFNETRYFSHAKQRVCRPRFEGRITSTAAKEYMSALTMTCQPEDTSGFINWQACMTGAYAQRGQARAQAVSAEAPGKRDQLNDEILRLAGENEQFGRAILDFYAVQQEYEAARKPVAIPIPEPVPRCEASAVTEYVQQNAVAHVDGSVTIKSCPAGSSGNYDIVVRVKDANGEIKPLAFNQQWQHSDAQDVKFGADYPIGENVEVLDVGLSNFHCTCSDPAR